MTGQAATRQETVQAFVQRSKRRGTLGIRQSFLQRGRGQKAGAGVLAGFIRRRDRLALNLYLLLLLLGRGSRFGGHTVEVQAGTWTRALGLEGKSRNQILSRALKRLEERKLIVRTKTRRGVRVEILKEDGSGSKYTPPGGSVADPYFQLPLDYWTLDHYLTLETPGTAMLLIALGERAEFELLVAKVFTYYGISAETADRGFEELVRAGLIGYDQRWVTDAMHPEGRRVVKLWQLLQPYQRERSELTGLRVGQARLRRVK